MGNRSTWQRLPCSPAQSYALLPDSTYRALSAAEICEEADMRNVAVTYKPGNPLKLKELRSQLDMTEYKCVFSAFFPGGQRCCSPACTPASCVQQSNSIHLCPPVKSSLCSRRCAIVLMDSVWADPDRNLSNGVPATSCPHACLSVRIVHACVLACMHFVSVILKYCKSEHQLWSSSSNVMQA